MSIDVQTPFWNVGRKMRSWCHMRVVSWIHPLQGVTTSPKSLARARDRITCWWDSTVSWAKSLIFSTGKRTAFSSKLAPSTVGSDNSTPSIFFVSGERLSNTLVFELRHQWTGLLVEANPFAYRELLEKNRKYEQNISIGGAIEIQRLTHN